MKPVNSELTQEQLCAVLDYDAETGVFKWRRSQGAVKAGDVAGAWHCKGYRQIHVGGRLYLAHRLAWLYVHGVWPAEQIDHCNGNRGDNRLANLRETTHIENHQNKGLSVSNKSGFRGVSWDKKSQVWYACVMHRKKSFNVGRFATAEEAAKAAEAKRQELFTHHRGAA